MASAFWLRSLRSRLLNATARTGRRGVHKRKPITARPYLETLEERTLLSYVVTTTADSGPGSLRDAINQINLDTSHALYASPSNPNVDEIDFNIPETDANDLYTTGINGVLGFYTIQPLSALPTITTAVIIAGTSESGFVFTLEGASAGSGANGLNITAGNSNVNGLTIDGFSGDGIELNGAADCSIVNNFITNSGDGIELNGATDNTIQQNIITKSGNIGIELENSADGNGLALAGGSSDNTVVGNTIDDNAGNGVCINGSDNIFGVDLYTGGEYNPSNFIFGNGNYGVDVNAGTFNRIQYNSIYANASGGIFLNAGSDANNDQSYPTLTSVRGNSSATLVVGTLASAPDSTYTIDFYANPAPDPSGFGQGEYYLGTALVSTDGNGNGSFSVMLGALPAGAPYLSATATDAAGDTSQFSADLLRAFGKNE